MTDYTVIRSHRRTMALEVTREGAALVRAPYGASDAAIARFAAQHQAWLESHMARRQAYLAAHPAPSPQQAEAWRQQAKAVLPQFGSCSGKNRLSFSLYLMAYPAAAIEYVVVHELAHIRHHDHSPAFYAEVERYLPDWRARRELLKN